MKYRAPPLARAAGTERKGSDALKVPCVIICLSILLSACGGGGSESSSSMASSSTESSTSSSGGSSSSSSGSSSSSSGSSTSSGSSSSSGTVSISGAGPQYNRAACQKAYASSSSSSGGAGASGMVPAAPIAVCTFAICAYQVDSGESSQSFGTVCGNNPNFAGDPGWPSGVPKTCRGIAACTFRVGSAIDTIPNDVVFVVSASPDSVLGARLVNCFGDDGYFSARACRLSTDGPGVPGSHSLSLAAPTAEIGGTYQELLLSQTTSSAFSTFPVASYPAQFILIYDQFGNADILYFSETFCTCNGNGCPPPGGSTCDAMPSASTNMSLPSNIFVVLDTQRSGLFQAQHPGLASSRIFNVGGHPLRILTGP